MDAGVLWIVGLVLSTGVIWWVTWESPAPSQEADSGATPSTSLPLQPPRLVVGMVAVMLCAMDMAIVLNLVILPSFIAHWQEKIMGFIPLITVPFLLVSHFGFPFWAHYMDSHLFRTGGGLFLFPCATISAAFIFSVALFVKVVDGPVFSCAPLDMGLDGCERGVPDPFFVIFNVLCILTGCAMVPIIGHAVLSPEKEKESAGRWFPPAAGKAKRTE